MARRLVFLIVAILALTACYVCGSTLPLVWDGAFQLSVTLIRQQPFVYLTRFHTIFLWRPTIWASHFTDNPQILQAIYGFPFIIAPAVSVAACWWLVRKQSPGLILWVIFGVAAGTLPGQVFIINDSIWQQTLFWPLYFSVFVTLTTPQVVVLGLLGVFQFVHQSGVALFLGATAAALLVGRFEDESTRPRYWRRAVVFGMLALLAVAKIVITNHISSMRDTYADQEFRWWVAKERWNMGVAGYPLHGLECAWMAALCLFCSMLPRARRFRAGLGIAAALLLVLGGGIWIYWAGDPHRWYKALDYRRWILPLSLPFFILACVESILCVRRRALSASDAAEAARLPVPRAIAGVMLAGIFAAVLGIQSTEWRRMLGRLVAEVDASPALITPLESVKWAQGTPLDHWATSDAITLLQGKQPRRLLLTREGIKSIYETPPVVPNQGWFLNAASHPPPPGPQGWIDFAPFLRKLAADKPAPSSAP